MTNYQRIFKAISEEIDDLVFDTYQVNWAYTLNNARGDHLDKIGAFAKYPRPLNLNDEQYRSLLKRAMLLNTGAGTLPAIKSFLTGYLGTNKITIYEPQIGTVTVALDKIYMPRADEIRTELQQLVACGIRIDLIFANSYWDEAKWDEDDWV